MQAGCNTRPPKVENDLKCAADLISAGLLRSMCGNAQNKESICSKVRS